MALARTASLRAALERMLPRRPFSLRFWDGTSLPATEPESAAFTVHSPAAIAHLLRAPGELGLGRAFALGLIETDDLDAALRLVDSFEAPPLRPSEIVRLTLALIRAAGIQAPPRRPATELRLRGERHTPDRDRRAVRHHYDAGNDFFGLFLDDSMTYSCAYWRSGASTLEDAQAAKRELVCQKLGLRRGERLLDVGSGWGSLAIHAASEHGVRVLGVTLSEPQVQEARRRASDAGVSELVEFRVADYRELGGEQFDAISSIGMVEHVGEERIDLYARTLFSMLTPGGRVLNHGIAKLADFDAKDEGAFSERFVFPDGVPLPLSRIIQALERAGLATTAVEGLAEDYVHTLTHWIERFESRHDEAIRLAGEERARVWRLYLHAARLGFTSGWASVYQVLAHRPAR